MRTIASRRCEADDATIACTATVMEAEAASVIGAPMPNTPDFVAHVVELMRPARAVAKAMFGGHGVYVDGLIVAIVVADTLYLKSDESSRGAFDALSLPPFEYMARDGRRIGMTYRRAPDEALESGAEMQHWLRLALAAALAKPGKATAKKPRRPAAKTKR